MMTETIALITQANTAIHIVVGTDRRRAGAEIYQAAELQDVADVWRSGIRAGARRAGLDLRSTDNIPYISRRGGYLYNLWKDANNRRGLWRRTLWKNFERLARRGKFCSTSTSSLSARVKTGF